MRSMARPLPRRRPSWLAACAVAGAGSLVLASSAWGAPSITRATPGNGDFWNTTSPSYVITGVTGEDVTWSATGSTQPLEGTVNGSGTVSLPGYPAGPLSPGTLTATDSTGSDSVNFAVDIAAPALGATLVPGAPNANGWYRSLTIRPFPCSDDGGSGLPGGACADPPWTTQGPSFPDTTPLTATIAVTDLAGNSASAVSPGFKFDSVQPTTGGGQPSQPGPTALVAAEPAFTLDARDRRDLGRRPL